MDHAGTTRRVGRLHGRVSDEREAARLELDPAWRRDPLARLYMPSLRTARGTRRGGGSMPLYGAIGDSAPDRWGRTLMRRRERDCAKRAGRAPRILRELDHLVGVEDEVRAGNLRFKRAEHGSFLGGNRVAVPTTRALPRLLAAVKAHETGEESQAQVRLLLESGELLGGSRPKACVRDAAGALWIAKFPSVEDGRDKQRWEALTLGIARDCGLDVPSFALVSVAGERILLLRRFDRERGVRLGFVSAFGLLDAQDNEAGSFVGLADELRRIGARPQEDIAALWRRLLFSVLVSDKDNHLRNHGLILREEGWRLAPIFDINAEPQKLVPREFLMSIDGIDDRATLAVAFAAAPRFGVQASRARAEARRMAEVISTWRRRAAALKLPRKEIETVRPAFEHDDLRTALRLRGR